MRHLSVSPVPNLGKTLQLPQSDLTPWTLTLPLMQDWVFRLRDKYKYICTNFDLFSVKKYVVTIQQQTYGYVRNVIIIVVIGN